MRAGTGVNTSKSLLKTLLRADPELVRVPSGDGSVLVSPRLGGRIFCSLDDELLHRLNPDSLAAAPAETFDNPGGNFLWPAPEGGPFGFNYPRGAEWTVQEDMRESSYTSPRAQSSPPR